MFLEVWKYPWKSAWRLWRMNANTLSKSPKNFPVSISYMNHKHLDASLQRILRQQINNRWLSMWKRSYHTQLNTQRQRLTDYHCVRKLSDFCIQRRFTDLFIHVIAVAFSPPRWIVQLLFTDVIVAGGRTRSKIHDDQRKEKQHNAAQRHCHLDPEWPDSPTWAVRICASAATGINASHVAEGRAKQRHTAVRCIDVVILTHFWDSHVSGSTATTV